MISIYAVKNWSDVAAFLVWTLAVCAIAKAMFGSLLAAEMQYRVALRDAPRRQRMSRLNWEIKNRAKWDEDVARRSQHAATQPLSDEELHARTAELRRISHRSLPWRALQYLLGCWACQTFWAAFVVYALSAGVADPPAWICSAAAYSSAAVLLSSLNHRFLPPVTDGPPSGRPGCKGCGK